MSGRIRHSRAVATALAAALVALLAAGPVSAAGQASPQAHAAKADAGKPYGKRKKKAPKQRPTFWGAWIGTQLTGNQPPWDMAAVSRFEQMSAKPLSLIEFAAPFADCGQSPCSNYAFPKFEMDTIRNYGAIPFFSWGSQSIPVPGDLSIPDYQLADIGGGAHDAYIREFAEAARDWGHPFFLRFDWEMNSDWFPWAEGANGNGPGQYIAAWRHVHDIFASVGATNATWVWCPYAHAVPRFGSLAGYYPGDDAVDWTCLDGFNWAKNGVNSQPWRSFDQIFHAAYRQITRKIAPKKPMLLAEFASGGKSKRKAEWITQMFKDLRTKYKRVRGLIWFEQIDRGVQWPIESSPKVTKAFSQGIRQAGFKGNLYGGLTGGPIGPPS
jgi:mannan endo-1,4-beta-mannosidase